jgi:hypothetical protein
LNLSTIYTSKTTLYPTNIPDYHLSIKSKYIFKKSYLKHPFTAETHWNGSMTSLWRWHEWKQGNKEGGFGISTLTSSADVCNWTGLFVCGPFEVISSLSKNLMEANRTTEKIHFNIFFWFSSFREIIKGLWENLKILHLNLINQNWFLGQC